MKLARQSRRFGGLICSNWAKYASWVRNRLQGSGQAEIDGDFSQKGFKVGTLPESALAAFFQAFPTTVPTPIREDDHLEGYVYAQRLKALEEKLNTDSVFYRPSSELMAVVRHVNECLSGPVSKCLGTPFRVLNVRLIKTLPAAPKIGPYGWHSDGFPADILKIMVYFTPVGGANGTTELRLADGSEYAPAGPAGTWLLFRNTELVHRGLPPQNGARIAMELTVCPSLRQDNTPIFAGFNAAYPEFPWQLNEFPRQLILRLKWRTLLVCAWLDFYVWQKRLFSRRKNPAPIPSHEAYQTPPQK